MATTTQSKSPPFFNFLKEGLLLPTHNWRLFAAVLAIIVASSYLPRPLGNNDLAVEPLAGEIGIGNKTTELNGTDPSSQEFLHVIQEIMDDTRKLLLITSAVDQLVSMGIGWVTQIILLSAAVATYSGELHHTFPSLLGKAKVQLKGPLLTLAFVYVLELAGVALLPATARLLTFLMFKRYHAFVLFTGVLLVLLVVVASVFVVYFSFVCSLSIIVAVAEPGCHGASAVGRAWRLMKGKLLRAMLFVVVTVVIDATIWPVFRRMASGLLLGFASNILKAAMEVFNVCTKTAFYYDCKGAPRHRLLWSLPKTR